MEIFNKLYVGVKQTYKNEAGVPLAFSVPYKNTKEGEKLIKTVDTWLNGWDYRYNKKDPNFVPVKGTIIDNVPMSGYKISGFASRWSTDNKTIRVTDPRGYELELYVPNFMNLLLDTTIQKGEILDELIWGREGGQNALIKVGSSAYNNALFEGEKLKAVRGDIVVNSRGEEIQYLGKVRLTYRSHKFTVVKPKDKNKSYLTETIFDMNSPIEYVSNNVDHGYLFKTKNGKYVNTFKSPIKIMSIQSNSEIELDSDEKVMVSGSINHNFDGTSWKVGYGWYGDYRPCNQATVELV